jgi:hypothetical protein
VVASGSVEIAAGAVACKYASRESQGAAIHAVKLAPITELKCIYPVVVADFIEAGSAASVSCNIVSVITFLSGEV